MKRVCPDIMDPRFDPAVLEEEITCACCGKRMMMGKGIKSRYPAKDGKFYVVCRKCHEKEWDDEA